MDLVNVGRQTQNDPDTEAAVHLREITQLTEDLVRPRVSLAPHDHSLLPNEVLGHIFILLAFGYGTVKFPIWKNDVPPQLVVSHVCSHWRRVALCTTELWSDTHIFFPTDDPHLIGLHQQWLIRARTLPVTLSIALWNDDKSASAFQSILLRIQVKRLSLCLTYERFMALATLPEATVSRLSELEIDISFPDDNVNVNMNDPHPLVTRLQSVTFHFGEAEPKASIDSLPPNLPWSQLRSLTFNTYVEDLDLVFGILRQTPMLEALSLAIPNSGVPEQLTMSSLRNLTLDLDPAVREFDQILCSFVCPSLTKFSLGAYEGWTETFKILKRQYNMQELREVAFKGYFTLRASSFLRDAPMLRSLLLGWNDIMDDATVMGISNGSLGRFLRRLEIYVPADVGKVLDMVEARKKTVDALIKNGCSWREEITILKDIVIHTWKNTTEYKERVIALKAAGIAITFL
jgi:hypothetical protein